MVSYSFLVGGRLAFSILLIFAFNVFDVVLLYVVGFVLLEDALYDCPVVWVLVVLGEEGKLLATLMLDFLLWTGVPYFRTELGSGKL